MSDLLARTATHCAHCEGVRFRWRVKRIRAAGTQFSQRTLLWTCQGCGAEVEEAIALQGGARISHAHEPPLPTPG